jgi:hypothetical protein
MNRLTEFQQRANAQSASHWVLAADHRRRVMQRIECNAPAQGRVLVLGAGNCNDLDLPRLLARFTEVHLVDLDDDALRQAVARQGVQNAPSLKLHGGHDLTGVWDSLDQLSTERPDPALLEKTLEYAARPRLTGVNGPFELVVSTCVLSQLIKGVADTLGEAHPQFLPMISAVRLGHLRLLADLAAPEGRMLVITDFVSSDSAPDVATAREEQLEDLSRRLLEKRNFFHGLNPSVLAHLWRSDAQLAAATANLQVASPWRWDFGARSYLVTAFEAMRKA